MQGREEYKIIPKTPSVLSDPIALFGFSAGCIGQTGIPYTAILDK
jgi:hypothetical protein